MSFIFHRGFLVRAGTCWLSSALVLVVLSSSVSAANKSRLYDFEGGTAGSTTTSLADSITDLFFTDVPDVGLGGLDWVEVPGTAGRPLPAGGVRDAVDSVGLTAPALEATAGNGLYVDVSDGSALDSPAAGSTLAIEFDGNDNFDDFNTAPGMRGVFVTEASYANNDPVAGGTNTFENFSLLSQAWVYPRSSAQGQRQTVYQVGNQQGAAVITADGFWEATNLAGAGPITTSNPVVFDQWSHIAIFRGGGSATFWVNGTIAGSGSGSFGQFAPIVSLGSQEFNIEPFTGLVDNFTLGGTGDLALNDFTDLDFFSDTGVPEPTGVLGDVDQDGDADIDDYNIWAANFAAGFDNGSGQGNALTLIEGDLDQNGRVDVWDFNEIAKGARAQGNPLTGAVPEPSTLLMLSVVGGMLTLRRRR